MTYRSNARPALEVLRANADSLEREVGLLAQNHDEALERFLAARRDVCVSLGYVALVVALTCAIACSSLDRLAAALWIALLLAVTIGSFALALASEALKLRRQQRALRASYFAAKGRCDEADEAYWTACRAVDFETINEASKTEEPDQ